MYMQESTGCLRMRFNNKFENSGHTVHVCMKEARGVIIIVCAPVERVVVG